MFLLLSIKEIKMSKDQSKQNWTVSVLNSGPYNFRFQDIIGNTIPKEWESPNRI